MRRADRLFQIVQYIRNRRLTTAKWLAERLEVSERTIYRDIQDLTLSGVPIEGEAGVGYVLRHGFDIPPIMFTKDEVEALVIAARMAKTWAGQQLARSTQNALDKIEAVLPDHLRGELLSPRLYTPEFLHSNQTSARLDEVRNAINAKNIIRIEYLTLQDDVSERELRPLGLLFWGKVWTLAAWCELRQAYRSFRIDRIQTLAILNKTFAEEEDGISLNHFLEETYSGVDKSAFL